MPRRFTGRTEKTLTEQGANLIQSHGSTQNNFQGDFAAGSLLRPVSATKVVSYLPMTFQIIPPDVDIDTQSLLNENSRLIQLQNDPNSSGPVMRVADLFGDSDNDYLLNIQAYRQIPALTLYINPQELIFNDQQRANTQNTAKYYKTEFSGRDMPTIQASGKIGAFYTDKTGLSRYFRRNSASYQQLMRLYLLYQNNGYLYESSDPYGIGLVGSVQITYDSNLWQGSFTSFSMSEAADNPYTMEYSFEFRVRYHDNNMQLSTNTAFQRGTNPSGSAF